MVATKTRLPETANAHDDLIPREAMLELHEPRNGARTPRTELSLRVDTATLEALQRGLYQIAADRDSFQYSLDSHIARLRRSESVVRIYIQFVENVTKGKHDADYIREAAGELLGVMY